MAAGDPTDRPSRARSAAGIDVVPDKRVTVGVTPSQIVPGGASSRPDGQAPGCAPARRALACDQEVPARLTIQMTYNVRLEHAAGAHRTIDGMTAALGVLPSMVAVNEPRLLAMQ